jgi:hypothetical protein
VIVLDDVSLRYMKVAAAAKARDVNLGIAQRSLLNVGNSNPYVAGPPDLSVTSPKMLLRIFSRAVFHRASPRSASVHRLFGL